MFIIKFLQLMENSENQEIKGARQINDFPTNNKEYFMNRLIQMTEEIEFISRSFDKD